MTAKTWYQGLNNINYSAIKGKQLQTFCELLLEWNQKMNLTTITTASEIYIKHFYDSLLITNYYHLRNETICDVGSGAGMPGIVLKIFFPEIQLTIIEANNKKCLFLETVVKTLGLADVHIIHERAEIFAHNYRETYDLVLARAVAALNILIEICLPLVKIGGAFIAYKGEKGAEELQVSRNGIKALGAVVKMQATAQLPETYGTRTFYELEKVKLTPLKYPRTYAVIKKQPL